MKIIEFHIQNFKSIVDTKLILEPTLSVLTGENNCGKTTVIEALALWVECFEKLLHQAKRKVTGKYAAGDYVFGTSANNYFDFSAINSVRSPNFEDIFNNKNVKTPIRLAAQLKNDNGGDLLIPFVITNSTKSRYVINLENEGDFDYTKFKTFFSKFPNPIKSYFSAPLANVEQEELFLTDPIMQDSLRQRRSFEIIRNRLYRLYHSGSSFSSFQEDLSYVLYGSRVSAKLKFYSRSDVQHDTKVIINYTIGNDTVEKDVALLGSGTLQAIEILLDLYNQVNGLHDLNLILLDEPDSHIHRDIQKRLYEVLTRYNHDNQIVLTTHNESMIRTVPLSHLFHVDTSQRIIRCVGSNELEKLNQPHFTGLYPAAETPIIRSINGDATGLDLISAIEAEKIFLVEGDDDARLLYFLFRKNPNNQHKKIMFWVLGGVSKIFSKFDGYKDVFSMIKNGRSLWEKSSLVFDQDIMMDKHIDILKDKLNSKYRISCFVANVYTQESVLLTDTNKLATMLCKKYNLEESLIPSLSNALNNRCSSFVDCCISNPNTTMTELSHRYENQYLKPLNTHFDAGIKYDIVKLATEEIPLYIKNSPASKLAKKEDVERIINEAGNDISHNFDFNIETDFYELVKLSTTGLEFDIWNEIIRFMSK